MISMDTKEITRYITHLIKSDRKPAAKTYKSSLYIFSSWLDSHGKTFDTFNTVDVEEYMSTFKNHNTANMFSAAIRGYMKFRVATLQFNDPTVMVETQRFNQLSLVKPRAIRAQREKVALTSDELKSLLDVMGKKSNTVKNQLIYAGTILHFYFGARPVELAHWLRSSGVEHPAQIDWKNNEMQLWTAKVKHYRYLPWHESITPILKMWHSHLPLDPPPAEWMTRHINKYTIGGVHITAKTGRKTVQTQMRLGGVDDFLTDCILGHVSKSSAIGSIYTDFTMFQTKLQDVMREKHYMIIDGVI